MTTTAEPDQVVPVPPGRRFAGKLVALVCAIVLLTGAAISATAVSFHYLHATPLKCACGLAWSVSDRVHQKHVQIGMHSGTSIRPDAGTRVAFEFLVSNDSSVTQTVLGSPEGLTSLHARLEVARHPGDAEYRGYRSPPGVVAPGGAIWLRYSFLAPCTETGTTLSWDGLDVRVRVGAFTRTEYVDFGDYTFAMTPRASAGCR